MPIGMEVSNATCCGEKFFLPINYLKLKQQLIIQSLKSYQPNTHANIKGATIVASLSTINFGV